MAQRTLPGLGLTAYWDLGYDGYKDEMDVNFLRSSSLTQLTVIDRVLAAALPGSPSHGMTYIVTDGAYANNVAVYDTDAWVYMAPSTGWRAFDAAAGTFVYFNGSAWVVEVDLSGLESDTAWVPVGQLVGTGVALFVANDLPGDCVDFAISGSILKSAQGAVVGIQISDDNGATYKTTGYKSTSGGTTSAVVSPGDGSTSLARNYMIDVQIIGLASASATLFRTSAVVGTGNNGGTVVSDELGTHQADVAGNAFKLFTSAGTLTVDLRVYGRKNIS